MTMTMTMTMVMTMTMTMTMTNDLLNINAYCDSAKYSPCICKKIIFDHEYKFMSGDYN